MRFKIYDLRFTIFLGLTLLLMNSLGGRGRAFAQNELSDYQYQYEKYRQLYPQFTTARDKYLQFQTLNSQKEAVTLTKQLLLQRDQVMRTHFLLLRRRLRDTPEVVNEVRTRLGSSLDTEIEWFDSHMQQLEGLATPTLGQLLEVSAAFERRERNYRLLSYEVLSRILWGNTRQLQGEAVAITFLLDEQINKQEQSTATATLQNWVNEARNSAYWSQQGIEAAEGALEDLLKYKGDSKETVRQFSRIQSELEGTKQWLVKIVSFQKEIIAQIKGVQNGR